jgi:RNAse (barnase) inhibitor barstar
MALFGRQSNTSDSKTPQKRAIFGSYRAGFRTYKAPRRLHGRFLLLESGMGMDLPLKNIRPNIVQSIRAFSVAELQAAADQLGHHFLYAKLFSALTKQDVLDLLVQQFKLATTGGKNFDALHDSMTDTIYKSGPQTGFVVVLEQVPANAKFDKEGREQLLDIFRDTADYWGDRKIPFRCFYSFL